MNDAEFYCTDPSHSDDGCNSETCTGPNPPNALANVLLDQGEDGTRVDIVALISERDAALKQLADAKWYIEFADNHDAQLLKERDKAQADVARLVEAVTNTLTWMDAGRWNHARAEARGALVAIAATETT